MRQLRWRRWILGIGLTVAAAVPGGCYGGTGSGDDAGDATAEDTTSDIAADGDGVVVERCGSQVAGGDGADAGNGGTDTGEDEPELPQDFTYSDEYKMRFTDFALDDDSPGSSANSILQDYLDQSREYPIIVLLHLDNVDPEAGTVDLRGGAGLKVDTKCNPETTVCDYQWDPMSPEDYYQVELESETGELEGGLEVLDFVGTNSNAKEDSEHRKFVLPIRDIYFSDAHLAPDGDQVAVEGGHVEGYVTREDAENARVVLTEGSDGTKVSSLLGEDEMNYDADGDGDVDSWCLSATFSAKETAIVQN